MPLQTLHFFFNFWSVIQGRAENPYTPYFFHLTSLVCDFRQILVSCTHFIFYFLCLNISLENHELLNKWGRYVLLRVPQRPQHTLHSGGVRLTQGMEWWWNVIQIDPEEIRASRRKACFIHRYDWTTVL